MQRGNRTQETVYLYKRGDPKVSLKDSNIRRRLKDSQPTEDKHLQERRLSKFLKSQETLAKAVKEFKQQHLGFTLQCLSDFVGAEAHGKLPTTLLLKADVNEYLDAVREQHTDWKTISIHSKECPNFKSTLKLIVNRFTENDPQVLTDRRLTYDFYVLLAWLQQSATPPSRLLVVIEDANSFDAEIICSLISHMHSYVESQKLPLHLVLNLSTPLQLFEQTITHDNEVCMETQVLLGAPNTVELVEHCSQALYNERSLKLKLGATLVERVTSLEAVDAIKQIEYAILGHFAGNPLASLDECSSLTSTKDLVRRLPSVDEQLKKDPDYLSKLFDSSGLSIVDELPEAQVGGNVLDIAFNPNYRPVIETALTDPRVFLGMNKGQVDRMSIQFLTDERDDIDRMSIPLCVLYQLSRESSIYINIYDFYSAFKTMLRGIPNCENWDTQSMAIFLETITALKMIGILRDCKRKFECVEKVAWKGV